jgi:hypothetical protein
MSTELLASRYPERLEVSAVVACGLETEDLETFSNVQGRVVEGRAAVSAPREVIGSEIADVLFESLSLEGGNGARLARGGSGAERRER